MKEAQLIIFPLKHRWWFSKDSKWKDHQIKKPYNPILGEYFTCHWDINSPMPPVSSTSDTRASFSSETATVLTDSTSISDSTTVNSAPYTVHYLAEQISHHPPMSAYYFDCPEKDIVACGIDHLSAKFTGTAFRVGPGEHTNGINIMLNQRQEEYNLTHPWAQISGWLSGSLYIACGDQCVITCPKTNLKCIIEYKEESMFGRPKFAIEGKLFRYDAYKEAMMSVGERKQHEKLSKIPSEAVVATLHGVWNGKVYFKLSNEVRAWSCCGFRHVIRMHHLSSPCNKIVCGSSANRSSTIFCCRKDCKTNPVTSRQ